MTQAVRHRLNERAAAKRLRDELATYDTPAAIADLMAIADRQDGPDAARMRSILQHQLLHAHSRA